ncbi:hypothetical protein Bp8pS_110 [Bacillus phage vB_BpuM-BpSp]|nr:hypothetical protein Bp8pS_110 [Bacillus phage vB_BpuM-BpSp]
MNFLFKEIDSNNKVLFIFKISKELRDFSKFPKPYNIIFSSIYKRQQNLHNILLKGATVRGIEIWENLIETFYRDLERVINKEFSNEKDLLSISFKNEDNSHIVNFGEYTICFNFNKENSITKETRDFITKLKLGEL